MGLRGATHCSACPVLRHSESGPLGLSVRECGAAGCYPATLSPEYLYVTVGPQGLLVVGLPVPSVPHSASLGPPTATATRVPSAPPTGLDKCSFFYLLGVRLPCHSILCQFWLFFVFGLLLSFFWLCEEVQCVYLHLHLGFSARFFVFHLG